MGQQQRRPGAYEQYDSPVGGAKHAQPHRCTTIEYFGTERAGGDWCGSISRSGSSSAGTGCDSRGSRPSLEVPACPEQAGERLERPCGRAALPGGAAADFAKQPSRLSPRGDRGARAAAGTQQQTPAEGEAGRLVTDDDAVAASGGIPAHTGASGVPNEESIQGDLGRAWLPAEGPAGRIQACWKSSFPLHSAWSCSG